MYKTLHKKQGSVTVQLRFARSSVTFCAKRDTYDEEGNIDEIDIYKYTPYTCASNESTHSANVLFLEIYNGKMLSNFPL